MQVYIYLIWGELEYTDRVLQYWKHSSRCIVHLFKLPAEASPFVHLMPVLVGPSMHLSAVSSSILLNP